MKAIVVLLVFMSCVGYSHTDAEKWRYVDAILTRTANVASDDNWASEGRDPDQNNVLESWEGFLGRPGGNTWAGGWSIAERRAAFDWYLETLAMTNSIAFPDDDKVKVFMAFGTCKRLAYTNAVPLIRRAALNPNCVHRDLAIEAGVDLGDVGPSSTEFVETIVTNTVVFSRSERGYAAGVYACKVRNMNHAGGMASSNVSAAVEMFYRNRMVDRAACLPIDDLLCAKLIGYASSSNRLETLKYILSLQGLDNEIKAEFTATTNKLLSSDQPLRQINVGGDE